MTTITSPHPARRRDALIAGLGRLLMAVLAGLATFGILERRITEATSLRARQEETERTRLPILSATPLEAPAPRGSSNLTRLPHPSFNWAWEAAVTSRSSSEWPKTS